MKIGFESQLFLSGNKTGIGWCADNIIKELVKIKEYDCQCDYFILGKSKSQIEKMQEYETYGAQLNPCKWFHNVIYKLIWPIIPIPYSWFFGKDEDITVFFNFIVPPGVRGKTVAIVHDMAYKAYPETVNNRTRRWLQLTLRSSCRRADAIVTVSQFSKQEIIKYLNVEPDKITVMPNGVDLEKYHPYYSITQKEQAKSRYNIEGDYFLYLGTLEPRKNIERLITAYYQLINEFEADAGDHVPKLVLAGGKGWLYDSIFDSVSKLNIEDYVVFTGYVKEEDVPILMSAAKAFVFPSLYEGFGMPVIEAMACGTPVITSNSSSLPEIVGDAGILVNPESVEEIKKALVEININEVKCKELSEKGIEHAKYYTWENSVSILRKLYDKLL